MSKPIDTFKLSSVLEKFIPNNKKTSPSKKRKAPVEERPSITIDGVNVERGIMLTGGTAEYYLETLATFHNDGLERVNEIVRCLESNDIPLYITNVHALKSASANIGANDVSEAAYDLEMAALQGNMDFVKEKNVSFVEQLKALLDKILNALIEDSMGSKSKEEVMDHGEYKDLLVQLKKALEGFDIDLINKSIDILLRSKLTEEATPVVRDISKHILIVEYEEAISLIDILLA